jgi:hypothetical protein
VEVHRTNKVFVPGGLPKLTYNPRSDFNLETRIRKANDNLCKLMMVTGSTKSGKTVLVKNVYPRQKCIWFDGGSYSNEDEFWSHIISELDGFTEITESKSKDSSTKIGGKGKGEMTLPIPFTIGPSLAIEGEVNRQKAKSNTISRSRKGSPKTIALRALEDANRPLIIDDFHYIERSKQASIVRAVKSLIFDGLPVIFIAIPHRRLDAVKVEKEMTGRVEIVSIPSWEESELMTIATLGFPLLNVNVSPLILKRLVEESIGSPHLMQEFCRELCSMNLIEQTDLSAKREIKNDKSLPDLFKNVAQSTGKVMFDKLRKGPNQRSDRVDRPTVDGKMTDIYGLVLKALSEIKPGLEKVDYEDLRESIRSVSKDKAPQAHEISRVLEYMSKIAASDESSTPVLDWDKDERVLHITDPFLAYYLRWGSIEV